MSLVPPSSHGAAAGFAIGSSSLKVQADQALAVANGTPTAIVWGGEPTIVGSDLAVHAADKTLIDILTAGYYTFTVALALTSLTATLGHIEGAVGFPSGFEVETGFAHDYTEWYVLLTTPPLHQALGDQLGFSTFADVAGSAGTYDVNGSTFLYVTRLA